MAQGELLLKALDTAIWEMGEAFKGLPDADVWKRPDPRLLSIGELAVHVAYWEAESFLGSGGVDSPLVDQTARYYTTAREEPFSIPMGAKETYDEVARIHKLCKAQFLELSPDLDAINLFRGDWTWGTLLEYQVFHVAYHTGQMYSVCHLLGLTTVDN